MSDTPTRHLVIKESDRGDYLNGYVDGELKYSAVEVTETPESAREFAEYLTLCAEYLEDRALVASKTYEAWL